MLPAFRAFKVRPDLKLSIEELLAARHSALKIGVRGDILC